MGCRKINFSIKWVPLSMQSSLFIQTIASFWNPLNIFFLEWNSFMSQTFVSISTKKRKQLNAKETNLVSFEGSWFYSWTTSRAFHESLKFLNLSPWAGAFGVFVASSIRSGSWFKSPPKVEAYFSSLLVQMRFSRLRELRRWQSCHCCLDYGDPMHTVGYF